MLLSLGMATVKVYRKARVAILATGDELLGAGATPVPGKIVNSNSYSIAAQVLEAGGDPVLLGIAPDDRAATRAKILEGLNADIIITTGGVSAGDRDFVKESILDLGGEILFWKVNMKPGKPVAYAALEKKPVFALPGNPVAAMVAFELFVRPAMLRLMGQARNLRPVIRAVAAKPMRNSGERPHVLMCSVVLLRGNYVVSAAESQSSANMLSLTRSNGLVELAPGESLATGDEVAVSLLDRRFEMIAFDDCPAVHSFQRRSGPFLAVG
jgi:molybdopterin molybdotransferase